VKTADYQVIAQRHFRFTKMLPSASAQGGAKAMATASARFVRAISSWAAQTAATEHSARQP